jgi:hypothetical protein
MERSKDNVVFGNQAMPKKPEPFNYEYGIAEQQYIRTDGTDITWCGDRQAKRKGYRL